MVRRFWRRGFTLVEVPVEIAIVATLMVLVPAGRPEHAGGSARV
jgi:Tfp pilus assembly protein FimT